MVNRDQVNAEIRDSIPPMLWAMYTGSIEAGFTERQSMAIVTAYVLGMAAGRIEPQNPNRGIEP